MKYLNFNLVRSVVLALILSACGHGQYQVVQDKQNVLVIGDSISHGWAPYAAFNSQDRYNWRRLTMNPISTWPENARNTTYTLKHVFEWLAQHQNNDVIIWNNGIWNASPAGHVPPTGEDPSSFGTSAAQYEAELIQIAAILKHAAPRVIFLTTTQIYGHDTRATQGINLEFNAIAKRVLPAMGVEVVDLWEHTIDHPEWHVSASDLHFNTVGNEYISQFVLENLAR